MLIESTLICLALNTYYEARGETEAGQIAVTHVVMNRAKQNNTTVCKEIFRPGQFSWTKGRWKIPSKSDDTWQEILEVTKKAMATDDTTKNSTYFDSRHVNRKSYAVKTLKIGRHQFYRAIAVTK